MIETFSGRFVDPTRLSVDDICIEDIAHHLSLLCRFGGACREFYSVAEHSCRVLLVCVERGEDIYVQRAALLHDAAEAYLGDMPGPVKLGTDMGALFSLAENHVLRTIFQKFSVAYPVPRAVKNADAHMLGIEARSLMPFKAKHWPGVPREGESFRPMQPAQAKELFLSYYRRLFT